MRSLVFLLLVAVASAKVYERCELARVLKANGMDGYRGHSLADWVCVSWGESRYDTGAINHNPQSNNKPESFDYGIFQINSRYWCNNGRNPTSNGCNIRCSALLTDDVTVAINCAKRVVRDPNGINAWMAWSDHCGSGEHDFSSRLAGCGL